MNRKQRACIVSGFSLVVLSLLFPPASVHHPAIPGFIGASDSPASYGFLFTVKGKIDFARLFVEWLLIALVTGGLFYLLRGPDSPKPETRALASELNWRRLFWLSIALYVLIVALGITSYSLFRKVRRLEARIQNLKTIVRELPPPGTPYFATLTPQDVLQADSQYHYASDAWAAWVVAERQHVNACVGRIRRMGEEVSKPD